MSVMRPLKEPLAKVSVKTGLYKSDSTTKFVGKIHSTKWLRHTEEKQLTKILSQSIQTKINQKLCVCVCKHVCVRLKDRKGKDKKEYGPKA